MVCYCHHWYLTAWRRWSAAEGANFQHQDSYDTLSSGLRVGSPQCKLEFHSGQPAQKHAWAALKHIPTPILLSQYWLEGRHCTNIWTQNPKCNCCKLCLVQQFCCPSCTLVRSAAADHAASAILYIIKNERSQQNGEAQARKRLGQSKNMSEDQSIAACRNAGMLDVCQDHVVYKNKWYWCYWLSLNTNGRWKSCPQMPIHS